MKIPFLGPDIEQALAHLMKLTLLHNTYPIILAAAMSISLIAALIKPSRVKLLFFMGFSLLLIHFEYLKHILEPLKAQTLVTLTTETPRYTFMWVADKMITRVLPLAMLTVGLGCILVAVSVLFMKRKSHGKTKS